MALCLDPAPSSPGQTRGPQRKVPLPVSNLSAELGIDFDALVKDLVKITQSYGISDQGHGADNIPEFFTMLL